MRWFFLGVAYGAALVAFFYMVISIIRRKDVD